MGFHNIFVKRGNRGSELKERFRISHLFKMAYLPISSYKVDTGL
jgi:hypothetical protein